MANACIATLESFFCDNVDRSPGGTINLVDNQLQNIGNIDTSGLDFSLSYATPETGIGQFFLEINATYLDEYKEELKSPDGSSVEADFQGTITDETFQRAFPEWRSTTRIDWLKDRWSASLTFRYVDELEEFSGGAPAGSDLDSVFFTDLQVNYTLPIDDNEFRFTIGSNNVLDEDPETCRNSCGIIGMSPVAHDLPGRTIYVRLQYLFDGEWKFVDTTYTAADIVPEMLTPIPGATLTGSNVTFTWDPHGGLIDDWSLSIGSNFGLSELLNSGSLGEGAVALPERRCLGHPLLACRPDQRRELRGPGGCLDLPRRQLQPGAANDVPIDAELHRRNALHRGRLTTHRRGDRPRYGRDHLDLPRAQHGALGSVNANNAVDLFAQPNIDGGLIGGASLKADAFLTIVKAAAATV